MCQGSLDVEMFPRNLWFESTASDHFMNQETNELSLEEIQTRIKEIDRPKPELEKQYTPEEYDKMILDMQSQAKYFRDIEEKNRMLKIKFQTANGPIMIFRMPENKERCPCGRLEYYKECCKQYNKK